MAGFTLEKTGFLIRLLDILFSCHLIGKIYIFYLLIYLIYLSIYLLCLVLLFFFLSLASFTTPTRYSGYVAGGLDQVSSLHVLCGQDVPVGQQTYMTSSYACLFLGFTAIYLSTSPMPCPITGTPSRGMATA